MKRRMIINLRSILAFPDHKFTYLRIFAHRKGLNAKRRTKCAFRDPAGIRTQDPNIKSVMLYQLSYGIILSTFSVLLPFPFKVVQI